MPDPQPDEHELVAPDEGAPRRDPAPSDDAWDELARVLERVPFVGTLKRDLARLSRLVYERHVPRLAFVANADAGVVAVLAALLDHQAQTSDLGAGWLAFDADGRRVDVVAVAPGPDAIEALRAAADAAAPDLVVVLATPDEVRAGLGHHLDALSSLLAGLTTAGDPPPAVLPLVVQPPSEVHVARATGASPRAVVAPARGAFERQLAEAGLVTLEPLALGLAEGLAPVGLEALAGRLVEALPETARVEAARAFPAAVEARRRVASDVVRASSMLAATVAVTPLPLADLAVLAPLQGIMVTTIAYLSGRPWDRRVALEWLGGLGVVGAAGFGLRWGAQQAAKLVPGMGMIVSGSVAGAGTLAVGRSAMAWFLRVSD